VAGGLQKQKSAHERTTQTQEQKKKIVQAFNGSLFEDYHKDH
jgi:hypothetical protein